MARLTIIQWLFLIPPCGMMQIQRESNLVLIRAIRYAMLLAVLSFGLPSLALAHGDHVHAQITSPSISPSSSEQATVAPAVTKVQQGNFLVGRAIGTSLTKPSIQTPFRHEVASMASLTKSCSGECCCPGMSNCGMGSCCYSSLAPATNGLDFSSSRDFIPRHHYLSTALVMILGLDRPPKA